MPITEPGNARRRSAIHSLVHQRKGVRRSARYPQKKPNTVKQRRPDRGKREASQDAIAGARERQPVGLKRKGLNDKSAERHSNEDNGQRQQQCQSWQPANGPSAI